MIAVSVLSLVELLTYSGYYFFYYATQGYFASFPIVLLYAVVPIVISRIGNVGAVMSFWTYANLQVFG